jgi:hypothetical protein
MLCGCTLNVTALRPPATGLAPVEPASKPSSIAVVARISHHRIAALIDHQFEAKTFGESSPLAAWTLHLAKGSPAEVDAENDRLCARVHVIGSGSVKVTGRSLGRQIHGRVRVCVVPELSANGQLLLQAPSARVEVDRNDLLPVTRILYDTMSRHLDKTLSPMLLAVLEKITIPVMSAISPIHAALDRIRPLPRGGCLRLRPGHIRLGQPMVDPGFVRLTASISTRPNIEYPCSSGDSPTTPASLEVLSELRHRPTHLLLPIALDLVTAPRLVEDELKGLGRVQFDRGWVEIKGLRFSARPPGLTAHVALRGQLRGHLFGLPWSRPIRGEVAVVGVPVLDDKGLRLDQPRLTMRPDDRLTGLMVALKKNAIEQVVARRLRWPRRTIEERANALLESLGQELTVGDQRLPVATEQRSLHMHAVRIEGTRLVIDMQWRGFLVVGDRKRR